jgi:LysM repeat protein
VIPIARGGPSDEKVAMVADERELGGMRRHGRWRRTPRGALGWSASDDCQDPFASGESGEGLVLEPEPALVPSKRRPPTPAVAVAVPADASRYVVAEGDTLSGVAEAHNLTLSQICAWNHIAHPARAKIFPGEKLWVRGEAHVVTRTTAQATAQADPAAAEPAGPSGPAVTSYKLRDGDNLWVVAKRLKVKVADLMRWNHLDEDSVVKPGQVLKVGE